MKWLNAPRMITEASKLRFLVKNAAKSSKPKICADLALCYSIGLPVSGSRGATLIDMPCFLIFPMILKLKPLHKIVRQCQAALCELLRIFTWVKNRNF